MQTSWEVENCFEFIHRCNVKHQLGVRAEISAFTDQWSHL